MKTDHAISVMICCAMRLDELYSCVCRSEIEAMKTELEHKLENAKQSLSRLSIGRENLEKAQKDIQSQEQVNEYLDKEADTRLKQNLLKLEAESGKSTEIDYEANISETDKARLKDYDSKIKAVTDDIGRSVKQYEEAQKKLREASGRLEVQQNRIQETIDVITGCSQTAGLEDTRDCNGIVHADFYGDICLENKDSKVRPFMVEHHTHPILFSCSEWSSERAIELICWPASAVVLQAAIRRKSICVCCPGREISKNWKRKYRISRTVCIIMWLRTDRDLLLPASPAEGK